MKERSNVIAFPISFEAGLRDFERHFVTTARSRGIAEDQIRQTLDMTKPLIDILLAGFEVRVPEGSACADEIEGLQHEFREFCLKLLAERLDHDERFMR